MQLLRDIPIRRKLHLIIMLTSTVSLLLACAAFAACEWLMFRQAVAREQSTLAQIVGDNSAAAVLFNDPKSADRVLGALRTEPHVVGACIFTLDRRTFATYRRTDQKNNVFAKPVSDGDFFEANHLVQYRPIVHSGERIGTVYLESDLEQMQERLRRYAGIVVGVLMASLLVALALSSGLQHVVSEPILHLVKAARTISENKDYSVRATKRSQDELGTLVDSFNEMLAQIQQRDAALRKSEEHFRSLIENASDIILVLNTDGTIRYGSPSLQSILGYEPGELVGGFVFELVHADDLAALKDAFGQMTTPPIAPTSVEFRLCHKNGAWHTFEAIGNELVDGSTIHGVVVNARDITERKRAEERLKAFAARLERSNRDLQDFAYVASHDLQEPLRKIQAFGDRLKAKFAETLSDDGRDYLARMQNAAQRMQTLINDLLSYSRVTTKGQPFKSVNLAQVAHEVLSDLEVRIEQTRAHVEIGELPTIDADALQMRQLLQNLIGNALKFHRKDEPPQILVEAHKNGDAVIHLTVKDNGIGFEEKYNERIFGVFQRLHGREAYEGTGVGLAICRKIAERHSGSIVAKSSPGQGATFTISLPVSQPKGETEA